MSATPLSPLTAGCAGTAQFLLNGLTEQVYVKDTASRFVLINNAAASLLKVPVATAIGKTDYDFFPRSLADQFFAEENALLSSGQPLVNREVRLDDAAGPGCWLQTTKTVLRDDAGNIIGLIGINRDVTERHRAQEQLHQLNADLSRSQVELLQTYENLKQAQTKLIQTEKLELIGRLAAGIAHEVKNPLAIMLMGLGYLEDCLPTDDIVTLSVLQDLRDAVRRADAIVCELLDFSSPRHLDLRDEDLGVVVEHALLLVRHELGHRQIHVVRELTPHLPAQRLDRIRIEQVFVNLFMNAIHAMPTGGRLTVRTFRDSAGQVAAEVCDTGPGIAPEQMTRVFDPFYTTKPAGAGSGMGLAVAKNIMTQHGGTVTLANRSGDGVCACVTFRNGKEPNHGNETSVSGGRRDDVH